MKFFSSPLAQLTETGKTLGALAGIQGIVAPEKDPPGITGVAGQYMESIKEMIYGTKETQYFTHEVFNKILIIGVDKDERYLIVETDQNTKSLADPESSGYLGYEKPFIQTEPGLGSASGTRAYLRYLRKLYMPPYTIKWKTMGLTDLRPNDVVTVDGTLVRINNISQNAIAEGQDWHTEFEGEWIASMPELNLGTTGE